MDNTVLNNIKARLIKERDTRRRFELESANASANGYVRGVEDTLAALAAVEAAEQQAQNADTATVVRGYWTDDDGYEVCSCCRELSDYRYKYCPNCGAKMEGEGSNGNQT